MGGSGGSPPGQTLRASRRGPPKGPSIGRRRVATGANHPASQSSALRRGPGTPAVGAPAGDQSTGKHVTPNLPLVRQDRITRQSHHHGRLVRRFSAVWRYSNGGRQALCPGRADDDRSTGGNCLVSGRRRLTGRDVTALVLASVGRHVKIRGVRLVLAEAARRGRLPAAVGEHDSKVRNDQRTDRGDRGKPAEMIDKEQDRGDEADSPDAHHDQVPALAVGDIGRQAWPRLRHQVSLLAMGSDCSHTSTVCREQPSRQRRVSAHGERAGRVTPRGGNGVTALLRQTDRQRRDT
jgi:hypothetical protein